MNREDFQPAAPGRLLRVGQGDYAYWSFVPNPLPPQFDLTLPVVQLLSSADRALGELAGLGSMIPNPHLLIRPFIRREAVLSSRIEGTQANIADVYAYEAGQLMLPGFGPLVSETDIREVLNYVYALEYGLERLATLPVSLRLLREMHEKLMVGVRGERLTPGEFRRSQNWIGNPGCTLQEAAFVPPAFDDMMPALYTLEKYIHEPPDYPPLIRLALIHYQFEAIHPFLDGNGRIGRLLIILLMIHWKLLPLPLLYLSAFFDRHREQYYKLLMTVSTGGAWHEWVSFFLEGVVDQAHDAINRARALQNLQRQWHDALPAKRSTGLMHGVVDMLFENPILAASDIITRFGVTHRTAMQTLRRLESLKMVEEITRQQRHQRYLATAIMNIIQQ